MSPTKIATPLVNPQQTRTIKPGPTVIDEAVQFCPATVGIKCISDTNVVKPIQLSGSDKKPESEKSVSASAIQPVSSRIPRFGKQAPKVGFLPTFSFKSLVFSRVYPDPDFTMKQRTWWRNQTGPWFLAVRES